MPLPKGDHIVRSYDDELKQLDERIDRMGQIAIDQTRDLIALIVHRDEDRIAQIFDREDEMNELEYAVNVHAVRLMALRQPMAGDLRIVVTSLKIAGMLERISDYTASAARRAGGILDDLQDIPAAGPIDQMGDLVVAMLGDAMSALHSQDEALVARVRDTDIEVDKAHTTFFRTLIECMNKDPRKIPACSNLMFVSKNLERSGDQATNIAESAYYRITGRTLPQDREKKDTSSIDLTLLGA